MSTPNLALETVPSNSLQPSVPINDALQVIDALMRPGGIVQDKDLTTPPTTVLGDIGKRWIVATGATGAWAGQDGKIALCTAAVTWRFFAPTEGWRAYVLDEDTDYLYSGSAWAAAGGGAVAASAVSITDAGGYFTGTDVEAALQELGAGGGGGGGSGVVTTISGTTYTLAAADDGAYLRFTSTSAKTVTIDPNATTALPANGEWFIRNQGTNNLTISPGGGVTVNLPSGGSLVIGTGGSCVLKRVASDNFDLL